MPLEIRQTTPLAEVLRTNRAITAELRLQQSILERNLALSRAAATRATSGRTGATGIAAVGAGISAAADTAASALAAATPGRLRLDRKSLLRLAATRFAATDRKGGSMRPGPGSMIPGAGAVAQGTTFVERSLSSLQRETKRFDKTVASELAQETSLKAKLARANLAKFGQRNPGSTIAEEQAFQRIAEAAESGRTFNAGLDPRPLGRAISRGARATFHSVRRGAGRVGASITDLTVGDVFTAGATALRGTMSPIQSGKALKRAIEAGVSAEFTKPNSMLAKTLRKRQRFRLAGRIGQISKVNPATALERFSQLSEAGSIPGITKGGLLSSTAGPISATLSSLKTIATSPQGALLGAFAYANVILSLMERQNQVANEVKKRNNKTMASLAKNFSVFSGIGREITRIRSATTFNPASSASDLLFGRTGEGFAFLPYEQRKRMTHLAIATYKVGMTTAVGRSGGLWDSLNMDQSKGMLQRLEHAQKVGKQFADHAGAVLNDNQIGTAAMNSAGIHLGSNRLVMEKGVGTSQVQKNIDHILEHKDSPDDLIAKINKAWAIREDVKKREKEQAFFDSFPEQKVKRIRDGLVQDARERFERDRLLSWNRQ